MGSISLPNKAESSNLASTLDQVLAEYCQKHPLSKQNYDEACQYMPGGNTRTVLHVSPFPLTIASGESCRLKTIDDHIYVDFLGEYTAGIYGHSNPVIKEAIQKALNDGWNYGGPSRMERELARTVCTRFPSMERVRFVNSGTEANMMALATALGYTKKKKVLLFQGGYHGSTISGKKTELSINLPHDFVLSKYNDIEHTRSLVSSLPPDSLAAILVEPMLGSGGCFVANREFLTGLRDLATQHNALLIVDEVMTSRLVYHGFHTAFDIKPDLMTVGKWVGGGMSFGAFGGRKDVMDMFDPRAEKLEHPGTFNNNVFSMTAGLAGCALLTESRLDKLNDLGDQMREAIDKVLVEKYGIKSPWIPDAPMMIKPLEDRKQKPREDASVRPPKMFITGKGSMMAVHFAGPDCVTFQTLFYHHMLGRGIYMAQRGFVALSIEIQQSHVDDFVKAVDEFCENWVHALRG